MSYEMLNRLSQSIEDGLMLKKATGEIVQYSVEAIPDDDAIHVVVVISHTVDHITCSVKVRES